MKFTPGQRVIALKNDGSGQYIKGEIYVVKQYNPEHWGSGTITESGWINTELDSRGSIGNGWVAEYFTDAEKYLAGKQFNKKFDEFLKEPDEKEV